ncbi:MAG: helix-turn-helix domain-containing protein [Lentisphaerae bacterium]|nr:helix-turn-helix domain-containing protein [Lentisphaerota bacterium]
MTLIPNMLKQVLEAQLAASGKLTYLALAYHANSPDGIAWPSVATLRRETSLSKATLARAIDSLQRAGFLSKTKTGRMTKYMIGAARADAPCKPANEPSCEEDDSFSAFWDAYPAECPRKVDKAKCRRLYAKLRAESGDARTFEQACIAAIADWKRSDLWTKDGGKYIRSPLSWLRSRSWEDKPLPASTLSGTNGKYINDGYKMSIVF